MAVRRQTDERFRRFIEGTPNPVAITRAGRVVFANRAVLARLGYDRADELVGRPVAELVHPDERQMLRDRLRLLEETGEPVPVIEHRMLHHDGSIVYANAVSMPIVYDDLPSVVVVGHDLTELKRTQAELDTLLRETELARELFETIVRIAPVGIALLSGPELRFELANPVFQSFAPGYELVGRRFATVAPEMPNLVPLLARVLETGAPLRRTAMPVSIRRRPDGPLEHAWFTINAVRVRNPCDERDAVLGTAVEATEYVRSRQQIEALAEENHRRNAEARGILENIVEGVIVCDAERRVTYVNGAARRLLDLMGFGQIEQLVDAPHLRFNRRDGRRMALEDLAIVRALAGEVTDHQESIVFNTNTRRKMHVEVSAGPIRNPAGAIIGAVSEFRDVSELTELHALQDQFIRVAAHELKTPVTVMKGYALALLRSAQDLSPERRRMLEAIERGTSRLDRLVGALLDVPRIDLRGLALTRGPVAREELGGAVVGRNSGEGRRPPRQVDRP